MLCSIGELASYLGVAVSTLRRWDREGRLPPVGRTPGGHRRYDRHQANQALGREEQASARLTVAYARVSSHDQKSDLQAQAARLAQHCHAHGWDAVCSIEDLGSGLNFRKPGLRKLLHLLLAGQVRRLVLTTSDRLLRFGSELIFSLCQHFGVEVHVLDVAAELSPAQRLTEDLVAILTVFSSRLYGHRSHKNRRILNNQD